MDRTAMDQLKQNYLDAEGRTVTADFDMMTIPCAHGWMLGQFLFPAFNSRTDEYGTLLKTVCDSHWKSSRPSMNTMGVSLKALKT
ncbi:MAG: hypothetical protein ACI4DY_05290 [Monoglobaceae bacterium]